MQKIYMQSNEHFEVFTTVFSPQMRRTRTRHRHAEVEKMMVTVNYRPHWPDELELRYGDVIYVLFKDDESWWFGRRHNGQEGYFPATYVTRLSQKDERTKVVPSSLNGSSDQAMPGEVLGRCASSLGQKSPRSRKEGVFKALASVRHSAGPTPSSHGLLHRILSRPRGRSECPADLNGAINEAFEPD